jgi:UPF0716 protein FxsA
MSTSSGGPGTHGGPGTGSGAGSPRLRMSSVVGAVGVLAVLDIVLLIVLGAARSVWWPVGVVLADLLAGWLLVVLTGRQAASRFRELRDALTGAPRRAGAAAAGRPGWTFLAALLVFLPGLLTDAVGLVVLVPAVQRRLGEALGIRSGGAVVRSPFPAGFDPRSAGRTRAPGTGGRPEDVVVESESSERAPGTDPRRDDENGPGTTTPPRLRP